MVYSIYWVMQDLYHQPYVGVSGLRNAGLLLDEGFRVEGPFP